MPKPDEEVLKADAPVLPPEVKEDRLQAVVGRHLILRSAYHGLKRVLSDDT